MNFTPEDNFVGTASGISIRRTDDNGYTTDWVSKDKTLLPSINEVMDNMDGLYIPTVTPKNIEGVDKTSTDVQGATQTGKPSFTEGDSRVPMNDAVPATFDDGSTTKTVEGVGTYTVAADATVTFVPENHSSELHQQ